MGSPSQRQLQATTVTKLQVKLSAKVRQTPGKQRGAERGGGELKKHQSCLPTCRNTTQTKPPLHEHSRRTK